jgi:hypothetical protein
MLFAKELFDMEKLRVSVVGLDIVDEVTAIFDLVGLSVVNQVNTGMLGNLKMLTYEFDLDESEVIGKRKALMDEAAKYRIRLMPMYVHGDWMRVFIFKTIRI